MTSLGAMAWLLLLMLATTVRLLRTSSGPDRVLAFDLLGLQIAAFLLVAALRSGNSYHLDAALLVALLSFIGTLGAARFLDTGEVF